VDPLLRDELAVLVDHRDIVVPFGPVDPAEHLVQDFSRVSDAQVFPDQDP
jgi:hypothetical protein